MHQDCVLALLSHCNGESWFVLAKMIHCSQLAVKLCKCFKLTVPNSTNMLWRPWDSHLVSCFDGQRLKYSKGTFFFFFFLYTLFCMTLKHPFLGNRKNNCDGILWNTFLLFVIENMEFSRNLSIHFFSP